MSGNLPDGVTDAMIDALCDEPPPQCRECDDAGCPACDDGYDQDAEDSDCHWCGGEGWVECRDPIQCTRQHRTFTTGGFEQWCRCGRSGGSGLAKDMTIW